MANDAVRRIMAEVKEFSTLNNHPTAFFSAAPLETDLFEWHFTVRGPPDTPFEYGVYHGRILLPAEYPLKAPEIILLTPNGRFEVGTRICLSVTSHHQETWQPSWGIRTILTALVGFMPSKPEGVGALDYPADERRGLAKKSHTFYCARCETTPAHILSPRVAPDCASSSVQTEPSSSQSTADCLPAATPEMEQPDAPTDCVVEQSEETVQPPDTNEELDEQSVGVEMQGEGDDTAQTAVLTPESEDEITPLVDEVSRVGRDTECDELDRARETESNNAVPVKAQRGRKVEEAELLYIAYAIVGLMVAIVMRRIFKIVTE